MTKNAREFKKLRLQLGLSQAKLAKRLDCHLMGVSMKERGITPVSDIDLMALKYLLISKQINFSSPTQSNVQSGND